MWWEFVGEGDRETMAHGKGTVVGGCDSCAKYEGEYRNGRPIGVGKFSHMLFEDTDPGLIEFDISLNGIGKITLSDGTVCAGEFKNGYLHGHGKMTRSSGVSCEGEWNNGIIDSSKMQIYCDGNIYEGKFEKNVSFGKGFAKVTYLNGNIYEGELQDKLPDGKGKFIDKEGNIHEGEFKGGCLCGQGKIVFHDRVVHEGIFQFGYLYFGTFTDKDGCIFYVKNSAYNMGRLSSFDGVEYEPVSYYEIPGDLTSKYLYKEYSLKHVKTISPIKYNDHKHDHVAPYELSKLIYSDRRVYEGETIKGIPNGRGVLKTPDGDIDNDEFVIDIFELVKHHFDDIEYLWETDDVRGEPFYDMNFTHVGKVYKGEFKHGYPNGYGRECFYSALEHVDSLEFGSSPYLYQGLRFHDGGYEGEFVNGKYNGYGKLVFSNGSFDKDIYEGEFKDGFFHGHGRMSFADGIVFESEFKDNEPSEQGRLFLSSGRVFEGLFVFEGGCPKYGEGIMTYSDGRVFEGSLDIHERGGICER